MVFGGSRNEEINALSSDSSTAWAASAKANHRVVRSCISGQSSNCEITASGNTATVAGRDAPLGRRLS